MQVAELRSLLKAIAQTVSATGGKKAATELQRVCETLDTFGDLTVAQFADFLAKADYYVKTGKLRRPGGPGKKTSVDGERVKQAAVAIGEIYERSIDDDVQYETIAAEVNKLDALNTKEVQAVAKELGIARRLTSKATAIDEIRQMIEQRKESYERTAF